jgi:hypothetical protein
MFALGDIGSYNFPITPGSIFDLIFHQTSVTIQLFGALKPAFYINLIQLIIFIVLAIAVNGITERLTSKKLGSLLAAVIVTIIGAAIFSAYVHLPFEFILEGVRIFAALFGAIVIAVFWVLIAGQVKGGK